VRELDIDIDKVNVNGGAISLGHPLGCSGAKLSIQLFNEMKRRNQKYGMVSACVGGGQGVAGIYELL
jgi:acetyl-CoA acyltransferase